MAVTGGCRSQASGGCFGSTCALPQLHPSSSPTAEPLDLVRRRCSCTTNAKPVASEHVIIDLTSPPDAACIPLSIAMRAFRLLATPMRQATACALRTRPVVTRTQWQRANPARTRPLHIATALMPPLIFTGLFVVLWCWKCTMLVLFQNAIIYNPFLPPNARSMRIAEFARQCGGVRWREERIRSLDGTDIALCLSESSSRGSNSGAATPVYILYFQGQ